MSRGFGFALTDELESRLAKRQEGTKSASDSDVYMENPGDDFAEDDSGGSYNKINLAHQNLAALPPLELGAKSAKIVWLQNNSIVNFPRALKALADMKMLRISDNRLDQIPSFVGQFQSLRYLSAERNMISSIAPTLCSLPNLEVLLLDYNRLEALPLNIGWAGKRTRGACMMTRTASCQRSWSCR